ncbi:MAG: hypothetical protein KDB18_04695, partial [Salinibacterium sp.]|nr:hypothetical protein [Salinibacterium sp.]
MRNSLLSIVTSSVLLSATPIVSGGEPAAASERVYFATASGVFVWSSDSETVGIVSAFPSYEIELSPDGVVYVGNGGADSQASGIATTGIFFIDAQGNAVLCCDMPADDLEFDEDGNLYASNSDGLFRIECGSPAIQVSTNP